MTSRELGTYLLRIRTAASRGELKAIAEDANQRHPGDPAVVSIVALAAAVAHRMKPDSIAGARCSPIPVPVDWSMSPTE